MQARAEHDYVVAVVRGVRPRCLDYGYFDYDKHGYAYDEQHRDDQLQNPPRKAVDDDEQRDEGRSAAKYVCPVATKANTAAAASSMMTKTSQSLFFIL